MAPSAAWFSQPWGPFACHYQGIRGFENLNEPLSALNFWNLTLRKWLSQCEEIQSNKHSSCHILFLVHQNFQKGHKQRQIKVFSRDEAMTCRFLFSVTFISKGNDCCKVSLFKKKMTKLYMFHKTTHFLALQENDAPTVDTQCLHMTNICMKSRVCK